MLRIEEETPLIGYKGAQHLYKEDGEDLIYAFGQYLDSLGGSKPPGDMMFSLLTMVYRNTLVTVPEKISSLLAMVIQCVWKTLETVDRGLELRERMLEGFDLAVKTIMTMRALLTEDSQNKKLKRATISAWTKLLRDVNMLELVGRLCSMSVVSSGDQFIISHDQFKDLAEPTRSFVGNLKNTAQIRSFDGIEGLYHTWVAQFSIGFAYAESTEEMDIAYHVAYITATLVQRGTMVHPQYHEEVFSDYFAASRLGGDFVFLPELGGFGKEDAVWLLEELWEDRKSFLQISGTGLSIMMHGWSVVLAAIWRHVGKLQDAPVLLKKLRNLLLRYALSALNPEFKLVCNIALIIEDQAPSTVPGYEELPPTDQDDASLMLGLFTEYLGKEKRNIGPPPGDMMGFPFAMVYRTTLNTLPDQVPSFLVAVIERVWNMLDNTDPTLTLRERIVDSYEYGLNAIMSMWWVVPIHNISSLFNRPDH
ncbi:hypothetical protein RSOLAG22IIIB_13385 [Rhizoctonia solani]|uniref:Uncharacterized protein n=1 Tax=Rhizoctonia solani TaxID=456999 RepID=A0A0K6FMK7_9AGAM|nr:hypothetical protein RSOLAG22IIIB_13385 [Rhizoctonia solani]